MEKLGKSEIATLLPPIPLKLRPANISGYKPAHSYKK